jgi:hypothetical protein
MGEGGVSAGGWGIPAGHGEFLLDDREFLIASGCRRGLMGSYLDWKGVNCAQFAPTDAEKA